jgi:hypothetical protein
MSPTPVAPNEGAVLYQELLAVHAIMRRGNALVADSYARLAAGDPVDTGSLVAATRWLTAFVHHHHDSEDRLLWPVLRERFPEAVADLDRLSKEHEALDGELGQLSRATDDIAAVTGRKQRGSDRQDNRAAAVGFAALTGHPAAEKVRDILTNHLGAEEPVLQDLFPQVPDTDIVRLRKAIVDSSPRSGPHLVVGLMANPEPVPGHAELYASLPAPLRWSRPLLMNRYRAATRALGASPEGHQRAA